MALGFCNMVIPVKATDKTASDLNSMKYILAARPI